MSDVEAEFVSELGANLSEEVLGNERFIEKLVRDDTSLAEKILARIRDLKDAFARLTNKEARAEHARLQKAEKLYLAAVENAGWRYVKGRIEREEAGESNVNTKEVAEASTGIRFSMKIQDYPYDMQKVIKEYLNGTDSHILNMVTELRETGKIDFERYTMGNLSDKTVVDLKELTGKDYSGYVHAINSDGIRHIEKRHGIDGEADNSLANAEDFSRLSYIVKNYDSITTLKDENGKIVYSEAYRDANNKPAPLFLYKKKINGTYYFVEAVGENTYKKLWAVSAYINKKELTHVSASDKVSRQLTSETLHASRSSNNIISEKSEKVKGKGKNNSGNVKYSLKETPKTDAERSRNFNDRDGQELKSEAQVNREKVYTRTEARQIINSILSKVMNFDDAQGTLIGSTEQTVEMLWKGLNSADPGERGKVALDVADYENEQIRVTATNSPV